MPELLIPVGSRARVRLATLRRSTPVSRNPRADRRPESSSLDHPGSFGRPASFAHLQASLALGLPDDPFEREADRIAERVLSTPSPAGGGASPAATAPEAGGVVAQRAVTKPGEDEHEELDEVRPPEAEKEEEEEKQRRINPVPATGKTVARAAAEPAVMGGIVPGSIEARIARSVGAGTPLSAGQRAYFEPRFGANLGGVRVHSDDGAAVMAASLRARAFTVGRDIFIGDTRVDPDSTGGRRLLAHELTHTLQQSGGARLPRTKPAAMHPSPAPAGPVQRGWLDDGVEAVLGKLRGWALEMPGYELLTVLLGRDPITDKPVERSATNLVHAVLVLVPDGEAIFEELQQSKAIERTVAWFEAEVAKLNLTWEAIKQLFRDAWDALSFSDVLSPRGAWEKIKAIFLPPLIRLKDFAVAVGAKIVDAIKDKVIAKLKAWAEGIRGYSLVKFILGKDPFTDEPVERTANAFVKAVLELVPGGDEIYANLEKSRTIERTMEWLEGQIALLDLTWEKIKGLFQAAWDALSVRDLLDPLGIIEKIADIFGQPARRVVRFAFAVGKKVLEFIFEGAMMIAGPMGMRIVVLVRKIGDTFNRIVADPVGFLGNLVEAVKLGFNQFLTNILVHLKEGLIAWLVGALEGAGIQLPETWDLKGVLFFVLQILGITYQKMRAKLVAIIGEDRVKMLERVFDFIMLIVTGGLAAAWEKLLESIGSLWDMVIGGIRDWAISKIIGAAVTKILTMLNPVGAIIQAIISIYNTIAFFVERINQIIALVEAIVDSIANVVEGKLSQAANYVEMTMARTIPVILGFLARLIGLGDVSGAIKNVVTLIQAKVDIAIDKVIAWVVEKAKALFGAVKSAVGKAVAWWQERRKFTAKDGAEHDLYFDGEGAGAELTIETSPQRMTSFFGRWAEDVTAIKDKPEKQEEQQKALDAAKAKYEEVKAAQKVLGAPAGPEEDSPEREKAAADLNERLSELSEALALHDVGAKAPLPPPVLPGFTSGVRASGFTATYINKKLVGTGSANTESTWPASWDIVDRYKLGKSAAWVRMHLLSAVLGGDAEDSNLVPARGTETNLKARDAVEHPARDALLAKGDEAEDLIWYRVDVSFHETDLKKYGKGFPSYIKIAWNGYEEKSGAWAEKPESGARTWDQSPSLPSLADQPDVLLVNIEGYRRIETATGVDRGFAELVVWARGGGVDTPDELIARLDAYADDARKRKVPIVSGFDANLAKFEAAASDPAKVSFQRNP